MRVAVLSGKGGAGKTFVAVNLAAVAEKSVYIDCDVEEPNGYLFLKPEITQDHEVTVVIPEVDSSLCNGCRICTEFCRFNALALVGDQPLVFEQVCHSCTGCIHLCPTGALKSSVRSIGRISSGRSENTIMHSGTLDVGEVTGVPIIKELKEFSSRYPHDSLVVMDCPPGSACPVVESIQGVDCCLLVTEPTPFGLHDLKTVHGLAKLFSIPCAVIQNKCTSEFSLIDDYCISEGLETIARIPLELSTARLISEGAMVVRCSNDQRILFQSLLEKTIELGGCNEAPAHP